MQRCSKAGERHQNRKAMSEGCWVGSHAPFWIPAFWLGACSAMLDEACMLLAGLLSECSQCVSIDAAFAPGFFLACLLPCMMCCSACTKDPSQCVLVPCCLVPEPCGPHCSVIVVAHACACYIEPEPSLYPYRPFIYICFGCSGWGD